ncbi:MAG: sigma 54-interacting transcriptional regulator [Bacillota bacterium]|nr:sigma 54-interacting transcriptional regulator [Bacillota bacterium]
MDNFGLKRVIEPQDTVPVTAWKLNNDREIGHDEIRLSIEKIHVEWDNFQQICTSCGYDDERVKARIMDIVDKRGKLHNPYTGSGGICMGIIDAIGKDMKEACEHKVGDRVYCITTLMALPLCLERIKEVDYDHGQFEAEGYAIIFRAEHMFPVEPRVKSNYTMTAIDEAGNFKRIYQLAGQEKARNIAILARDLFTPLIYGQAARKAMGDDVSVTVVLDETSFPNMTRQEIEKLLAPNVKHVHLVDETRPVPTYKEIYGENPQAGSADIVIVGEDIRGAETLAVLLVKDDGILFFSSIKSNYAQGVFVAETMGKAVRAHYLDQYIEKNESFTMSLVRSLLPELDAVDQAYNEKKKMTQSFRNKLKSRAFDTAEKINDFIFQDPVTREMVEDALNVAKYDCNVIIQGETGVGKEKVLQIIHYNSPRQLQPCIKINCATIQENLAEAEFFGYEKGAFTGAQSQGKEGYFELAHKGTLFLDEIGTLPLSMQSKLLRVLQENQYYRVGGTEQKSVDVRVVCANNIPLQKLVEEGKFREDLYYRLNICMINVPPLRERKEDILCLTEAFLANYSRKFGITRELSPKALELLCRYHWPGNVRELENVIQRLIINCRETVIEDDMVDQLLNKAVYDETVMDVGREFNRESSVDFKDLMEQQEKKIIAYALKKEGTTRKAAEFLNLPQATLARKKVKYGL